MRRFVGIFWVILVSVPVIAINSNPPNLPNLGGRCGDVLDTVIAQYFINPFHGEFRFGIREHFQPMQIYSGQWQEYTNQNINQMSVGEDSAFVLTWSDSGNFHRFKYDNSSYLRLGDRHLRKFFMNSSMSYFDLLHLPFGYLEFATGYCKSSENDSLLRLKVYLERDETNPYRIVEYLITTKGKVLKAINIWSNEKMREKKILFSRYTQIGSKIFPFWIKVSAIHGGLDTILLWESIHPILGPFSS